MKTRYLLPLFLAATIACAQSLPRIIPRPREFVADGTPFDLMPGTTRLVVCSSNEVINSGVELLQAGVTKLGGDPLAVASTQEPQEAGRWTILVGLGEDPAIKAVAGDLNVPEEIQGYAIRFMPKSEEAGRGGGAIVLSGHDPLGVLYACVTFKRLLSLKDGTLTVTPATVRDWPDYKYRALDLMRQVAPRARRPADRLDPAWQARTVRAAKRFIDEQLAEYKINTIQLSAWYFGKDRDDSLIEAAAGEEFAYLREVLAYAHRRGLSVSYYSSSAVGRVDALENDPRYRGLMELSGEFHTWGDDELIRKRFEAIGRALVSFGVDIVYVHHADTTNENWPNRSDHDRERFGDDRAKADANLVRVYTETLKKHLPSATVYATVHPYGPDYLDRSSYYHRFLERVGQLIPPDVGICVRESSRTLYEQYYRYYQGRPFMVYHEVHHAVKSRGDIVSIDRPVSCFQPRYAASFFFPNDRFVYHNLWTGSPLNRLIAAQFAWNVTTPGSSPGFNYDRSLSCFGGQCPEGFKAYLVDIIRELHGDACIEELTAFHSLPLRPTWLAMPVIAKQYCKSYLASHMLESVETPDPVAELERQVEAGRRAVELMDAALGKAGVEGALRADLLQRRKLALLFKWLGPAQLAYVQANHFVDSDLPDEARETIARGRELLDAAEAVLREEKAEGARWVPCGMADGRRTSYSWHHEYIDKVFRRRFDELEKVLVSGGSVAERVVPPDVLKAADERTVACVRRKTVVELDGRMEEKAWEDAGEVSGFIVAGKNKRGRVVFPEAGTSVRFLYDETGITVGVRCEEADTDNMAAATTRHDDFAVFRDDQVELFFMPQSGSGRYCQLLFSVGGTRLEMLPIQQESGEMGHNLRWSPDWRVKVSVQANKGWSAEVQIPWALFMTAPFTEIEGVPSAGTKWRVFVGRSRRQIEYSGIRWVESFHNVDRYPELVFE